MTTDIGRLEMRTERKICGICHAAIDGELKLRGRDAEKDDSHLVSGASRKEKKSRASGKYGV